MKSITRFLLALVVLTVLAVAPGLRAQLTPVVTTLHSFTGSGTEGTNPNSGLIHASDGNFYGTTVYGGSSGDGTVFRLDPTGVLTTLHSFTGSGTDGVLPFAGLIQASDGNFYGTTNIGGAKGYGTIFQITPAGVTTILHSFTNTGNDGRGPDAGLIQGADGNFYGTTELGGPGGGTIFEITSTGEYTFLFSPTDVADGIQFHSGVVQGSDGNFYGTTFFDGSHSGGTIFRLKPAGVYTVLHDFTYDGTEAGGLIEGSDGNFYGFSPGGGSSGDGTVYRITPAGVFTNLKTFTGTGTDGAQPSAKLIQGSDGNFYGTTFAGGSSGDGTIFRLTPTGAYVSVYSFTGSGTDGNGPVGLVEGSDGNLYGTTYKGGSYGDGTVYVLSLQPAVTSAATAAGVVDQAFSYQIAATNEPTSYGAQGLPAGLTVNTSTGLISGTPTAAGTFTVTITAGNGLNTGTATLTLTIASAVPVITSAASMTATEGKAFSYQITATLNPTSFAASGLPPGLSVDTATGVISGTPTQENAFASTVYATNANGTGSATLTIIVRGPLEITSSATASVTQEELFSYQITANQPVTTYSARGLPTGLTIDTATGAISGTPFNSGTAAIEISAGNTSATAFARLTITITPSLPVFTSPDTAAATEDQPFYYRLTATNAPTNFAARGLPTGLTLDETKGYITGRPINTGAAAVRASATNAAGTTYMRLTFTIASGVPMVTSAATATAPAGQAFSYQITATNTPTRYTATGLPTGLEIDPSTGLITGTPKDAGKAAVTLSATNRAGTGTAKLSLTITSS